MADDRKPSSEGLAAFRALYLMGVGAVLEGAVAHADCGWLRRVGDSVLAVAEPVGLFWVPEGSDRLHAVACLRVTDDGLTRYVCASPVGGGWWVRTMEEEPDAPLAHPWLTAREPQAGTPPVQG